MSEDVDRRADGQGAGSPCEAGLHNASTALDEQVPPNYAWNSVAFVMDSALFHASMSFLGTTTVLPALIARLTPSPIAIGLASGAATGGWLLPQLVVASAIAGKRRKKPTIVSAAWISRPLFFLVGLIVWLYAESRPQLTAATIIAGLAVFYVLDAVVSVPWFDLLAKTIPPRRRGRVLGTSQVLGGLLGMAGGVAVSYVLGDGSPWQYPQNHALLLMATSAVLLLSAIGLTIIREPEGKALSGPVASFRQVVMGLPALLQSDRPFLRLVITRVVGGSSGVANAFFVLHATDVGGLALGSTGLLVSAQVLGSLAAGLLMGYVQDRTGPRAHIRIVNVLSAIPALLALAASPWAATLGSAALYVYLLLFFSLGVIQGSQGWPFYNWVLEYAPEEQRPLYIGTLNTLAALVMLAPPIGGWILRTFSYPVLFAAALGLAACALALSAGLPSTRHVAAEAPVAVSPGEAQS